MQDNSCRLSNSIRRFFVLQKNGYCGPCCLSACLFMLGERFLPEEVAKAVGGPGKLRREGSDEYELAAVAESIGIHTKQVLMEGKKNGPKFSKLLKKHLRKGPALITCDDLEHWVAAITIYEDKFVIYDPVLGKSLALLGDGDLRKFCWNRSDVPYEPDQYFALLLWK